jgi:polysaccharide pyruvyl transferase WcaK-like protein
LLVGGTSATIAAIQTALVNYLNSLNIGEIVSYGALVAVAMSVNPNLMIPIVSVHSLFFSTTATPTTITDIPITFSQVSKGVTANVTVNSI